jgi:hypothetical protein
MVMAKDWSSLFSEECNTREKSPLKGLAKYRLIPGMISLGGGFARFYFDINHAGFRIPNISRLKNWTYVYRQSENQAKLPNLASLKELHKLCSI